MGKFAHFKSGFVAAILYGSSSLMGQTGSPPNQVPPAERERASPIVNESGDGVSRDSTVDFGKSLFDSATAQDVPPQTPPAQPSTPQWQYGGFIDLGYLLDFNHPANDIFRSRGTTWHVDDLYLNIGGAYIKKKVSEQSRWGAELALQGGKDSEVFGFSATAPNLSGYRWLRHVGLADFSYLASVGKGLTVQGGIFGSLVGYDGLYSKDNFEYTRPWGADYTPYLMMGVNASYPFSEKFTGTVFAVNGYWH